MSENNIKLRPLESKDIQGMLEWMHDARINKFFRFDAANMNKEKAEKFIKDSNRKIKEKTDYNYAITDEMDCYLGTISLKNVDWNVKMAEYAISLRMEAQGKGIGTIATRMLLDIAFNKLELNRVFLNVLSDNIKAIHLYEKCGFIYEGEFRQHIFLRGEIKDLKWYSILQKEYLQMRVM